MRTALVVQHAEVEGVGRFAVWLPDHGVELRVVRPFAGEPLPPTLDADALVVMGGPMGAYDDADVSWLPATKMLLSEAVRRGVPTLGVCLGAQLLAVAAGGQVQRGAAGPELGVGTVDIDVADALFDIGAMPVVQWHHDTVTELPPDACLLGSSDRYPVQAFRVGDRAWGTQFHVEATTEMVAAWARSDGLDETLAEAVATSDDELAATGESLARRFAAVVTG